MSFVVRQKACRIIAPLERSPVALLISVLATTRLFRGAQVSVTIVAPTSRSGVSARLRDLLATRYCSAENTCVSPRELEGAIRRVLVAHVDGRRNSPDVLVLDVSAATGETAVLAETAAAEACPDGFLVASYEPSRNTTRFLARPDLTDADERTVSIDVGDRDDVPRGEVTAGDLLGLFDLRLQPEDPYAAAVGDPDRREAAILGAAKAVLAAQLNDEQAARGFRRWFGGHLRAAGTTLTLDPRLIPSGITQALGCLAGIGLSRATRDGRFELPADAARAGAFLLGGGWLEILSAEALCRGLAGDRRVERNAGTAWGRRASTRTTYAEADAVFVERNHLVVVSCKNEMNHERILRHLDRLRALVAEFGETHVRPVLLSTEPLAAVAATRCAAYEIGVVEGRDLLDRLNGDMGAERRSRRLLDAVLRVASRAPTPGLVG